MKHICFFITVFLFATTSRAQTPEANLEQWNKINPIEKLYLQTDREVYYAGQTIWFKGYFLSDYIPSISNSTLYAELLDIHSKPVIRKIFPSYVGISKGQIELPADIESGTYFLRAYSPLMLNQKEFLFSKTIDIFGTAPKTKILAKTPALNISFFAEGGNIITGLVNTVAFKAVNENGLPFDISGRIIDNKGEVVTNFSAYHDGMGSFNLLAVAGQSYSAVINNGDPAKKYPLPVQTDRGIVFHVNNTARGKQFRIEQSGNDETFKVAYIIGQMQNTIIFKQPLAPGKSQYSGIIETANMSSGILQLTAFNKAGIPLAERLTFIDNGEYKLKAAFKTDTLNYTNRGRNSFSIALPDTIIGNFSISVTDADYETAPLRNQNIYSGLMMSSDIKGYIHNPAYYFTAPADSARNAADLVMMTNGWTRFKWEDAARNSLPKPIYKDPGYISLSGTIYIEGTKKTFSKKDLMMWIVTADSSKQMMLIKTDSLGRFKLDSQLFYDKASILFSDIRGRKSKFIKVKMDGDSLNQQFNLNPAALTGGTAIPEAVSMRMFDAYNDYTRAEGKMLKGVTVKVRKKSEMEKLDENYASGLFSGGINSRVYDLRNETTGALDVFTYLQGRVPGLTVNTDKEGQRRPYYRSFGGSGSPMTLYLDEVRTDPVFIESIPVNQIAFVKVYDHFVGAPGGGAGGVLAIYMKKGADLSAALDAATDIIHYDGYNVIKEFYSPVYKPHLDDPRPDQRITLLWNPNIYIANINPAIPVVFYNNDRTRRFKIIAEGVTNDGRMLMIEQIIGGDH